jgi:hypothetical protein
MRDASTGTGSAFTEYEVVPGPRQNVAPRAFVALIVVIALAVVATMILRFPTSTEPIRTILHAKNSVRVLSACASGYEHQHCDPLASNDNAGDVTVSRTGDGGWLVKAHDERGTDITVTLRKNGSVASSSCVPRRTSYCQKDGRLWVADNGAKGGPYAMRWLPKP